MSADLLSLSLEEKKELLQLARRALQHHIIEGGKKLHYKPLSLYKALEEKCGVFVTLKREGKLRGCIGYISGLKPLYQAVIDCTISSATQDPRFNPVRPEEVNDIAIEISVLSPFRVVASVEEIQVGTHGIMISKGLSRGLLLPQVAVEHGWDRITFIENACLKAGLNRDDWRQGAKIEVFSALVFGERELLGATQMA